MAVNNKKSRSTLKELRSLVDNLNDRDMKLKREFRLFEDFFEHFPLPVSMWSASQAGEILSIKDKGFFCKDPKDIKNLFKCEKIKDVICKDHKGAFEGNNCQRLIANEENTYYVSIVPRRDDLDNIIGVSGIAWDVSSNIDMINILKEIKKLSEDKSITLEDIAEKAKTGLSKSRLMNLLKEL